MRRGPIEIDRREDNAGRRNICGGRGKRGCGDDDRFARNGPELVFADDERLRTRRHCLEEDIAFAELQRRASNAEAIDHSFGVGKSNRRELRIIGADRLKRGVQSSGADSAICGSRRSTDRTFLAS